MSGKFHSVKDLWRLNSFKISYTQVSIVSWHIWYIDNIIYIDQSTTAWFLYANFHCARAHTDLSWFVLHAFLIFIVTTRWQISLSQFFHNMTDICRWQFRFLRVGGANTHIFQMGCITTIHHFKAFAFHKSSKLWVVLRIEVVDRSFCFVKFC